MFEITITEITTQPDGDHKRGSIERFKMIVDELDMGWVIKQITAPKRKRNAKKAAARLLHPQ